MLAALKKNTQMQPIFPTFWNRTDVIFAQSDSHKLSPKSLHVSLSGCMGELRMDWGGGRVKV